ncbi:hypothetical protein P5V15_013533 [Pogonomyrmex californicus]
MAGLAFLDTQDCTGFLLSRYPRELVSTVPEYYEKHADSIEAKLDRGKRDRRSETSKAKYEEVYEGSGDVPGMLHG